MLETGIENLERINGNNPIKLELYNNLTTWYRLNGNSIKVEMTSEGFLFINQKFKILNPNEKPISFINKDGIVHYNRKEIILCGKVWIFIYNDNIKYMTDGEVMHKVNKRIRNNKKNLI